jgi:hypothetical protein
MKKNKYWEWFDKASKPLEEDMHFLVVPIIFLLFLLLVAYPLTTSFILLIVGTVFYVLMKK